MTDKQRVEKTYAKIKEKYPHVTSKEEIDSLAIKLDKKTTLLKSLGFFAGAVAMALLGILASKKFPDSESPFYLYFCAVLFIFESFKIFSKYSKAEKLYKPVLNITYEGSLTRDKILEDGKRTFKKSGEDFTVYRLPLSDMEDSITDSSVLADMSHVYYFHFVHPETGVTMPCRVKTDTYMNAVIGTEYYVAVTSDGKAAAAYQATNWTVDPSLSPYLRLPQPAPQPCPAEAEVTDPMYRPEGFQLNTQPVKTQKALPVTALVLTAAAFITPVIVALPATVAAVVLSAIALTRQRSKLSVASFVVSVIWAAILVISLIAVGSGKISL